jgi:hypothetical protein
MTTIYIILMFSYPLKELLLLLLLLLSLLHTSIHSSIEQQRSEVLPSPIRLLSDHRSMPMSSVRMGRVRQAALRKQLWEELREKEIKVDLPYSTAAATTEVIIVIESDVYDDAVDHCNE